MRWPWHRGEGRHVRPMERNHTDRLPDGDRVVPDGYRRWVDLLREPDGPAVGRAPVPDPPPPAGRPRLPLTPAGERRARVARWSR